MYGLPANIDLSFLEGKELENVSIAFNSMVLNFDEPIRISITSLCRYKYDGDFIDIDNYPSSASIICSLLGKKIIVANSEDGKNLRLQFDDGYSFIICDDSEHYESYLIIGGSNGEIVV